MSQNLSAFVILGPTASGKTKLSLQLAEHFPCEMISLDSALVYTDMNIGTAKPSFAERNGIPHHLIDIISPLSFYSAADFVADCVRLVAEIHARGKVPLIVGGTMMYYQALVGGLNDLPSANEEVRERLRQQKERYGLSYLYQQLQQIDPITANRLEPNDSQRIERALEVFELTSKPLSEHFSEQQQNHSSLDLHTIALIPEDRTQLHQQINHRFEQMLKDGFLDEVKQLQLKYPELSLDKPSMRCVGYRQAWLHLAGEIDKIALIEQGQAATRQLAKRQLTWLRKLSVDSVLNPYHTEQTFQAAYHALRDMVQNG